MRSGLKILFQNPKVLEDGKIEAHPDELVQHQQARPPLHVLAGGEGGVQVPLELVMPGRHEPGTAPTSLRTFRVWGDIQGQGLSASQALSVLF